MNNNDVSLTISQEIVKPIVEAKIKEALIKSFGENKSELLNKIIDDFLTQRVDKDGKISSYSSDNEYHYIDILLRNMINEALKDAVASWVSENKDMIKNAVYEKLNTKAVTRKMAGDIISGLIKATKNEWRFSTSFNFKSYDD